MNAQQLTGLVVEEASNASEVLEKAIQISLPFSLREEAAFAIELQSNSVPCACNPSRDQPISSC